MAVTTVRRMLAVKIMMAPTRAAVVRVSKKRTQGSLKLCYCVQVSGTHFTKSSNSIYLLIAKEFIS